MAQHPLERPVVERDDGLPTPLGDPIEPALIGFRRMLEQLRAHHGCERQRDDGGNQDGNRQSDGELAEKPPDNIPHEQKRNQHCNQRDGERYNGETNLRRALERRLKRRLAFLDIARDVLDHHDGIVHHEAGGNGQGHQAQVIQAVTEQVHHAKRAHQRQRHRNAGITVAARLRRNRKMTITTRATVSINSNSTSATEARMVVVRSVKMLTLTEDGRDFLS